LFSKYIYYLIKFNYYRKRWENYAVKRWEMPNGRMIGMGFGLRRIGARNSTWTCLLWWIRRKGRLLFLIYNLIPLLVLKLGPKNSNCFWAVVPIMALFSWI
jgi:hypothetical protein